MVTVRKAQLLVFATSAAVLVLEILAGRLMAPYVGVSLETFTGIIGTILAGIALGSAIGGRLADQHDPRTLIGPSLVIGGLLSWASLPIVGVVGPGLGSSPIAIVMLAFLSFFAPAAVLSAVSPMVAKIQVDDLHSTGTVVGGLSAAGTTGALFGSFITGFVLVSAAPTRPIILAVGAALVVAGVWLSIAAGRSAAPNAGMSLLSVGLFAIAVLAPNPCEFESAYFCGRVVVDEENPSLRFLVLDTLRHGAVDLDDPSHLEFRYTRLIGNAIDAQPEGPLDVLHLGGGGFSIPQYLEATRPGSSSVVLEIDEVLLDVARDELGLVTSDRLQVRIGDARLAMDDLADDSFDVIVGDAFGGLSVPWHLTTTEFVAELDRVLRDDGVYVMNAIDGGDNRFVAAMLATLAEHFDHLELVIPADGSEQSRPVNQILVASDVPIPDMAIADDDGVLAGDLTELIDGVRPLTDDFAPVEQLAMNP